MPYDTPFALYDSPARDLPGRVRPAPERPEPCAPACEPLCPACGGLQCLCRPRFFPGQLLTDDDLNRLQRYVVDKNKLHNRYLEGWGVACGLEVVCDPCDASSVVVRTGYALSPCGDDIVVCKDQSVDICDLIQSCRPPRDPVCDPPYDRPVRDCTSGVDRWVLAICYDERPARGVTALTGADDDACGPRCTCGGSGGCGCGNGKQRAAGPGACGCGGGAGCSCGGGTGCSCGGSAGACSCGGAAKGYTSKPRKAYKPQCEPTQICEGYRFLAYPAPAKIPPAVPPNPNQPNNPTGTIGFGGGLVGASSWLAFLYANRGKLGPLLERVSCCVLRAVQLRQQIVEGGNFVGSAALDVYGRYADALRDFAADFGVHRCTFVGRVDGLHRDAVDYLERFRANPNSVVDRADLVSRLNVLQLTFYDILTECFCSALLPACPEPASSNCVPLAVVTVRRGADCRVAEICNWEQRKLLITWRNVAYWLSWLPWNCLQEAIAELCCGQDRQRQVPWLLTIMLLGAAFGIDCNRPAQGGFQPSPGLGAQPGSPVGGAFGMLGVRAFAGGAFASGAGAPAGDALQRALDAPDLLQHLAREGEQLLAGSAADAPQWATIAANLLSGAAADTVAGAGAGAGPTGVAVLNRRLDELQAQLADQQRVINRLLRS